MSSLLLQCAHGLMQRQTPATQWLWGWAQWVEKKRNKQVAATALARRLSGILWAMMRDGTPYRARLVKPNLEQQVATEVIERQAAKAVRKTRRSPAPSDPQTAAA